MTPEKAAMIDAEQSLLQAKRAYRLSLVGNDQVTKIAFLLFQRKVLSEEGWEGPVVWSDWYDLLIDSERDEWRTLAAEIIELVEEG